MNTKVETFLMGCLSFLVAMVVYALRGLVVYLMWNALMPDIFGLVEINFWQAVGFVLLISNLCTPVTTIQNNKGS